MTAYRTVEDLKTSLWRAKLPTYADAIARSAKPGILFLRVQAPDDALPVATSKMGGAPDLPEDFAWPTRAPYPDAAARAKRAREFAASTAQTWERQVDGPLEPHQRRISREEVDRLKVAGEARARAFGETFPLAFVGQIDFAAMAAEPGFDPDLPRTGLLSVFEDVTDVGLAETPAIFWRDAPREALKRRSPPENLVAHVDLCGSYGLGQNTPWKNLTMAETLIPFSAVTVPHHWKSAFAYGSPEWERIWAWFQSGDGEYAPSAPDFEGHGEKLPQAGYFGDRLGGWPSPIQGDVESEMDGAKITTPGRTDWRQIFAYAGEFYGGTRRMGSDGKGDGTTYHMIEAKDLAARRFERSRWTYQMD